MSCQNNQWIESQYCGNQCLNGACTTIQEEDNPEENPLCQDQTPYNQCSSNKPYFCSSGNLIQNCNSCGCPNGKQCTNNQCVEIGPYDPGGIENNNPNNLNTPPIILSIENKIIKINEMIKFSVNVIDREDNVFVNIKEQTNIANCFIESNEISCTGLKPGEGRLTITATDGINEVDKSILIKVISELQKLQKGVAAGIGNTQPVANAGPDKTGTPGTLITLDGSLSYDNEGLISLPETYTWYEDENSIGNEKTIKKTFSLGSHQIKLTVKDSEGLTSEDMVTVKIKDKNTCKNTPTNYFPEDTICNSKWPTNEGQEIKINSQSYSCSLFEVCSENLDPIVEESIACCTEGLTDPEKSPACSFARENSNNIKNCQAIYVIKGLGGAAILMDGYFDAEMCCKGVDALCPSESYLYTPQPLPEYLRGVKCSNTPDNNPNGYWASDTKLELNEIALFDAPAHSSLETLKTGTCVDYSVVATTLLRKIGFSSENILTVEATNHAYNLIKFDLDKEWTIFDMTGNNEGLSIGRVPTGYDYCENIINCYNDNGKVPCPSNKEIIGCENAKERIGRTTGTVGYKITSRLKDFYNRIKSEVLR